APPCAPSLRHALPIFARAINPVAPVFTRYWPGSAELYLPHGIAPTPGTRLRNPALAGLYRRIITEAEAAGADREAQIEAARHAWSQGCVAEAVESYITIPSSELTG